MLIFSWKVAEQSSDWLHSFINVQLQYSAASPRSVKLTQLYDYLLCDTPRRDGIIFSFSIVFTSYVNNNMIMEKVLILSRN